MRHGMIRAWILAFGLGVGLLSSGCFVDIVREEHKEDLLNPSKQWYVYKITLENGEEIAPKWENAKSSLSFETNENRIFGVSACNNYFATFALKGKKLSVSNSGWSRRICHPEESMMYEYLFIKNLVGEFEVRLEGEEMRLVGSHAVYYLR